LSTATEEQNSDKVFLVKTEFESLSGNVNHGVLRLEVPPESKLVFETTADCEFIVRHVGSHYGDLVQSLKSVVAGKSPEGVFCVLFFCDV
jgi:hypothetical protein